MAEYVLDPIKWGYKPAAETLLADASAGGIDQSALQPHFAQFDLSGVEGTLWSAVLRITAVASGSYLRYIHRVQADWEYEGLPPSYGVYSWGQGWPNPLVDIDISGLVSGWLNSSFPNQGLCIAEGPVGWELTTLQLIINTYDEGNPPPGGPDGTPPVVTIETPADSGEIAGETPVVATITDNVGVVLATLSIDGQVQSGLAAPNYSGQWRWVIDAELWANGEHTILVKAWDLAGNMGSDSVTVTINNNLADEERVWISEPCPGEFEMWDGRVAELAVMSLQADDPPTNPAKRYNLWAYVGNGAGVDLAAYTPIELDRVHGIPTTWPTVRWALRAAPAQVLAWWELAATDIVAMCLYGVGAGAPTYVALLTSDRELLSFDGTTVTELADLSGYAGTPHDVAYAGGKLLVGIGAKLIAYDLDAGDVVLQLGFPDITEVRQVEAAASGAWVAGDIAGGGRLLSFDFDSTRVLGDIPQIIALHAYNSGAAVAIGCAGGRVYASNGGAPVGLYETGQDEVLSLYVFGSNVLAGTGSEGRIYHSRPSWALEADLDLTEIAALGEFREQAYASGDSAGLWRRNSAGNWSEALILSDVTAVNCLLAYTDANGRESLLVGTAGAVARLYRLEVSEGSLYQTGTTIPDIGIAAVRMRNAGV